MAPVVAQKATAEIPQAELLDVGVRMFDPNIFDLFKSLVRAGRACFLDASPAVDPATWEPVAREAHAADARHAFAFEFVDYVAILKEHTDRSARHAEVRRHQ